MDLLKSFRINLGIPTLLSEWKAFFSTKHLQADLISGITVACVAIPLSLAIALASGVTPAAGLITAIIAGIVCALFGGTQLGVSGPAAAMSILLAATVEKFGVSGLTVACLLAGIMQLLSGICGFGRLGRYVPLPVIAGFTAGIGVIIIIGQLPRAFGLLPPTESHTIDVFTHLRLYFHETNWNCVWLVILTIAMIRLLPKIFPRLPSILIAVVVTSLVTYFLKLDIPLIGDIPRSLPSPSLPQLGTLDWTEILIAAFTIYLLASIETLLSCTAVDRLVGGKKHDSDQELIGQGLGNITVSFFGGVPVTGVIARSVTNIKAGGKTRRASIIHSLIILLTIAVIAPLISRIPIVALAGVLFSVAASMIHYREFQGFWRSARPEALIYVITFFTIIFVDLIAGIQAGLVAAALLVLIKAAKTRLHITSSTQDDIVRLSITGSLTFLSTKEIAALEQKISTTKSKQVVILNLSSIINLDSTGASAIIDLFNNCKEKQVQFYIMGLPKRFEHLIRMCGGEELLTKYYLISEADLRKTASVAPKSAYGRLVHGVQQFTEEKADYDRRLYKFMASNQDPHTLFITCSDSRIIPSLFTCTDPGELFTIRNVGNVIPPHDFLPVFSEAAALEFALNQLNITDIIVCGHTNCGAIRACLNPEMNYSPKLKSWIDLMKSQLHLHEHSEVNEVIQQNVLRQIENLKKYKIVEEKLAKKSLMIHGWVFDFDDMLVYEWNKAKNSFQSIITFLNEELKSVIHPET